MNLNDLVTYRTKIWDAMNELETVTSKICSAREIIDSAIDRIQEHQYDKAETMMSAAHEFLEYYLEDFDKRFKYAWDTTLNVADVADGSCKVQNQHYTDDELSAMCDAAEGTTLTENKTWVVPIEEDHLGEYYITFPNELIEKVNWVENDTLEWVDNKDGTFSIKKVEN